MGGPTVFFKAPASCVLLYQKTYSTAPWTYRSDDARLENVYNLLFCFQTILCKLKIDNRLLVRLGLATRLDVVLINIMAVEIRIRMLFIII